MADLVVQPGEERAQTATVLQHRLYTAYFDRWTTLGHARHGSGGFENGLYLVAHPREWLDHAIKVTSPVAGSPGQPGTTLEQWIPNPKPSQPSPKLITRRKLARYDPVAGKIIEQHKAALFRECATRQVGQESPPTFTQNAKGQRIRNPKKTQAPTRIEAWWENVDGLGSHIDDFLADAWDLAATFGHVFLVVDKPPSGPGATLADTVDPFIRVYTPLDAPDWLQGDLGQLTAIKFLELAPRRTFTDPANILRFNTRIFTETGWQLLDAQQNVTAQGAHAMGRLPVVVLFAKKRVMAPLMGDSLLGDPQCFIDLYNLVSELRELLRNQTFGILNIPLGTGDQAMGVEQAMALLSRGIGTSNVLFSALAAQYIQPDSSNVTVYQAEIDRLVRQIFRNASIPWESDSKDAESADSLRLKREDMNQVLAGYADRLEHADYALADLFYRALFGEAGPDRLAADGVVLRYPETFDVTPFEVILEQAQSAITLDMPAAFMKVLRKRLVDKWLPDLPDADRTAIDAAIDAEPDAAPTPALNPDGTVSSKLLSQIAPDLKATQRNAA